MYANYLSGLYQFYMPGKDLKVIKLRIGDYLVYLDAGCTINKHGKKMEMSEEIKDFITEPTIHVEEKFRSSYDYKNTCNFLLISNHENCMYINNEERRYWIKVMKVEQRDADYWKDKWDWIKKPKTDDHKERINFILYHLKILHQHPPARGVVVRINPYRLK